MWSFIRQEQEFSSLRTRVRRRRSDLRLVSGALASSRLSHTALDGRVPANGILEAAT